jgi:hypothetical protein
MTQSLSFHPCENGSELIHLFPEKLIKIYKKINSSCLCNNKSFNDDYDAVSSITFFPPNPRKANIRSKSPKICERTLHVAATRLIS